MNSNMVDRWPNKGDGKPHYANGLKPFGVKFYGEGLYPEVDS